MVSIWISSISKLVVCTFTFRDIIKYQKWNFYSVKWMGTCCACQKQKTQSKHVSTQMSPYQLMLRSLALSFFCMLLRFHWKVISIVSLFEFKLVVDFPSKLWTDFICLLNVSVLLNFLSHSLHLIHLDSLGAICIVCTCLLRLVFDVDM